MKNLITVILFLVTISTSLSAEQNDSALNYQNKEADLEIRRQLQQKIENLTQDPASRAQLIARAQRRSVLCAACHGKDGNSVVDYAPSLAGQNPVYLVDQFMRFGDGRRSDYTMNSLAKSIKNEDKIRLAIYFSEQTMKPAGGGQKQLIPHGQQQYQILCAECHGKDGKGAEQGYARLAGQRPEYIVKMLKDFKNQTGRRSNPWMTARANGLDEKDMQAIAAYLANIK